MQHHLTGTEVDVSRDGELFTKSRFMGAKRPRFVTLRGTVLRVGDGPDALPSHEYSIDKAKLQSQKAQMRIVLLLASKEKVTLYAGSPVDFTAWVAALTDSIQWKVQRFYDFGKELGSGAFSTVVKGVHRATNTDVAIKIINKGNCSEEDIKYLQREIDIARSLQHEYVTNTIECFESENNLYIVCEYMAGGTLEQIINRFGRVSETNAKMIMANIFEGVDHIHSKGIVHRDMKPENLLCTSADLPTVVKLTDFGLARRTQGVTESGAQVEDDDLGPEGLMTTPVGTPTFVAPEVLHGLPYGKEVDLFSCGVVMYHLLSGRFPFEHDDPQKLVDLIKRTAYSYPDKEWKLISDDAKGLIDGLLDRSPFTRLSARQALEHRWSVGLIRTATDISNTDVFSRRVTQHRRNSDMPATSTIARNAAVNIDFGDSLSKSIRRKSRLPGTNADASKSPTSAFGV
jgi:calcium/calmodulin-dependent protein kinase I